MWNNGPDAYLESRILSADPVELVDMLYQGCTGAVREARHHLAEGRIVERSREINKAYRILMELDASLDHERGGEISQRLAQLYTYMRGRLLEANMEQIDPPLTEVLGLLSTLSEGWAGVLAQAAKPVESAHAAWSQSPAEAAVEPWGAGRAAQPVSAWSQSETTVGRWGLDCAAEPVSAWSQPPAEEVMAGSHRWCLDG